MRTHRLMVSVVAAGLLLAAMALPAKAQLLDDEGTPYSSQYYRQSIGTGTVSLRRGENLLPGQFIVHLEDSSAPAAGCAKMSNIPAQVQFAGKKVKIDYLDYTVDMRDQPAGLPSRCVKNIPTPSADVILDAATLQEQGINKISLSHHGNRFELTLDITPNMIRVWPPYANKGKKQQSRSGQPEAIDTNSTFRMVNKGASTIWLYPKNTVILYVPDTDTAGKTQGLKDRLDSLAAVHNLKPLEISMPDFKSPQKVKNAFYYVARNDRMASSRGKFLDNIQVDTVNYGIQYDESATKDVPVFIRTPGQND